MITHRDIKPDNLFVTRDDRINCCRAREVHAARIFRQGLDGSSAQPMSQEGQTLTLTGVSTKGKLLPVIEVATGRTLLLSVAGGDGEVPKGILAEERIANWTADCSGLFVYQAGFFRADLKTGKRQLQWRSLRAIRPALRWARSVSLQMENRTPSPPIRG